MLYSNIKFYKPVLIFLTLYITALNLYAQKISIGGNFAELSLTPVSENTIRVTILPVDSSGRTATLKKDLVIEDKWMMPEFKTTSIKAGQLKLRNITIKIVPSPFSITFYNKEGKLFQQISINKQNSELQFHTGHGPLFGLGSGGQRYDKRGTYDEMQEGVPQNESQIYGSRIPVPLLINPVEKWSLFFHLPYKGAFDLRSGTKGNFIPRVNPRTPEENALPIDVFVSYIDSTSNALSAYTLITGKAPLPPKWTLGYIQSHRTLEGPDSIIAEAKRFREKKMPADAMVYLGTGYAPVGWNMGHANMDFNPKSFDQPASIIKQLQDLNFKVVLHVNNTPRTLHGEMAPSVSDTARDYAFNYWKWHQPVNKMINGWWPDDGDELPIPSRLTRHMVYRQGQLLDRPNSRNFALHRTGYAGMHRYGGWIWSGDCFSLWSTLEAHVQLGLNASLGASPYWGSDIGGFVATKQFTGELYARWFEFATFTPLFRSHGRQWKLHEPWGWSNGAIGPNEVSTSPGAGLDPAEYINPQIEPICKKFLELRYQLMPYTYTAARENYDNSLPLMRPLWMHYPGDSVALKIRNEYLWARNILVAPVAEKGATIKEVYLPEGQWYDFWTNRRYQGKQWISRYVELSTMPLYVMAGTILPMDPIRQYVDEPTSEPGTLRVYTGADGKYTLYEDDGQTLNYERNEGAAWTNFNWNDKRRILTIEPDARSSTLIKTSKNYVVQLIPGQGNQRQAGAAQSITYKGDKMEIKL